MVLKEDGTGTMHMEMDGSMLMMMAGDKMEKEGEGPTKIDSIISFGELFKEKKDSIAQLPKDKQELIKNLEKWDMHMLMDTETKEMIIGMETSFDDVSGLENTLNAFSELKKLNDKEGAPAQGPGLGVGNENTEVKYFYNGKTFKKEVIYNKPETDEEEDDSMEMYKQMFAESTYVVDYTFPKRIKSVSNKDAVISADRKNVVITYSFMEYIENPEILSMTIKFE
ncbi:hypothetical protein GCM10007424_15150 [Flavobacterium suaedae]|uniref:DUF4412 domain-containing protein n=2 Tax=Flavobacterium suaedae TaxID=1767027 RepID=A0ABQ1JS01_9FLAO|nr:hypothetical protein GCM10007424_15150 [Flavobacterium suaedae]